MNPNAKLSHLMLFFKTAVFLSALIFSISADRFALAHSADRFVLEQFVSQFALAPNTYGSYPELSVVLPVETLQAIEQKLSEKWSNQAVFSEREARILIHDFSSLHELRGTQVSSPLFREIFLAKNFDGRILVEWILKKFKVLAPTDGGTCAGLDEMRYVACYTPLERKIRLSPLFFKQGRLARLATLIHEARHSQGFPHVSKDNRSEDGVINGARGAELSFLAALSANCTNCRLLDRSSAFKYFGEVSGKFRGLNSTDQAIHRREVSALKDPLEERYAPLVKILKRERSYVHVMPSLCIGKVPYNEFMGDPGKVPSEDCILLYYFVDAAVARRNPRLLDRSSASRGGFLLIYNPLEKSDDTE